MLLTVGQRRARTAQAKADRRLQILSSAAAVCAAASYEELTVADVADRAGVAKGTVFRYFPTKEDLGRALAGEHLGRWVDDLDRRLARLPGPPAPDVAARLLVESLAGRRDLLALASRGLAGTETLDEASAATALERALPYLGLGGGARLLRTALASAAGLRATLAGDSALPAELHHTLRAHLTGLRAATLRGTV
jgi:AcrR family transcriptional regulator